MSYAQHLAHGLRGHLRWLLSRYARICERLRHLFGKPNWLQTGPTGVVFWFALISLISVEAASAERAPGTIRPGGVEREFQRPPEPKASPEPLVPAIPEEVAPAEAEQIEFTLQRIEFDGATVFQDVEFRSFYESFLDQRVTLAQIYGVADAITAQYRNAGYILSQAVVPAQKIRDGIVHLKVIEGYVAEVWLEGEIKGSRSLLDAYSIKITKSRPLRADDLERYLLLMNDLGGVVARATLASSESEAGASDLTVYFTHNNAEATLTANNRGSRFLGRYRAELDVELHSLFGAYETARLFGVATTADDELLYLASSYEHPVGTEGGALNLFAGYVDSNPGPGAALAAQQFVTNSIDLAIGGFYPVVRTRAQNFYVRGNFTYYNADSDFENVSVFRDRIRAVRIGATY